jgi:hypothetical protein
MTKNEAIKRIIFLMNSRDDIHFLKIEDQWSTILDFLTDELGMKPPLNFKGNHNWDNNQLNDTNSTVCIK